MDILIAVPTFENIYPDTFKSIYDLDKGDNNVSFEFVRGYDCATARNHIVQMAINRDVDYVLMVDNDVVLPKDILSVMLDDAKDVCLGYYAHRDADNIYRGRVNVCRLYDKHGKLQINFPLESEYTAEEIKELRDKGEYKVQIKGGGMGCAFIKVSVLKRLQYPWYDWVNYKNRGMLSEDLYFCTQCKKANIPIFTDTRAYCGHLLRHIQFPY